MSIVDAEIQRYTDRIRTEYTTKAEMHDPYFVAEWARLRKILITVDGAMEVQGIPSAVRQNVIRTALFASPDELAAMDRMAHRQREVELRSKAATAPRPFNPYGF